MAFWYPHIQMLRIWTLRINPQFEGLLYCMRPIVEVAIRASQSIRSSVYGRHKTAIDSSDAEVTVYAMIPALEHNIERKVRTQGIAVRLSYKLDRIQLMSSCLMHHESSQLSEAENYTKRIRNGSPGNTIEYPSRQFRLVLDDKSIRGDVLSMSRWKDVGIGYPQSSQRRQAPMPLSYISTQHQALSHLHCFLNM